MNASEIAEIVVGGLIYRDWSAVRVHAAYSTTVRQFKFTATENSDRVRQWSDIRVKPGDPVTIRLAGETAVTGYVNVRQTAYNAHSHGIEVQGQSAMQDAARSSVMEKGGQFKGYTFEAIAAKVLAPLGLKLTIIGSAASIAEPFKDVQVAPGETVFNFLDRLARQRGLYLGDDEMGQMVALAGVQGAGGGLVEGQNILALSATFRDDFQHSKIVAVGQRNGDDKEWGKAVSQIVATVENPNATRYLPFKFFAERPVTKRDLEIRANYEAQFNLAMSIEVQVVVYGWLRSNGGGLWRPGDAVYVHSPMALLDMELAIRAATFEQDDRSGTRTTLELCRKEALGGFPNLSAANGAQPFPSAPTPAR